MAGKETGVPGSVGQQGRKPEAQAGSLGKEELGGPVVSGGQLSLKAKETWGSAGAEAGGGGRG